MTAQTADLGAFCWSELATTDPARARTFYAALFGWTTADRDMGGMGVYTLLQIGGTDIGGLYELRGPALAGAPSQWLYYFAVADVGATAARAADLGGRVVVPPTEIPDTGRMAVLEDPEGARFAAFQPAGHPGARVDPRALGAVCWVELHARDTDRARAFYTELLGWHARESGAGGPHAYTEWYVGAPGRPFGGMLAMQPEWGDMPAFWLGYVHVADVDEAADRAQVLGAAMLCPPRDVAGVGRFAVLADPTGAAFAIIALAPAPAESASEDPPAPPHARAKRAPARTRKQAPRKQPAGRAKPPKKRSAEKKNKSSTAAGPRREKAPAKRPPGRKKPPKKRPAKKRPAKKRPAKKAPGKKRPAKKAPGKKRPKKALRKKKSAKKARR